MLNGLEWSLGKQLPEPDHCWPQPWVRQDSENDGAGPTGFPEPWTPEPWDL